MDTKDILLNLETYLENKVDELEKEDPVDDFLKGMQSGFEDALTHLRNLLMENQM